jgi:Zn-dependent protease
MGKSFRLGQIFGIPLELSYSWFLILGLVFFVFLNRFSEIYPHWNSIEKLGVAITAALFLFGSVLAHESAHSLVAIKRGIPVIGISLFIFGGFSQISREADRPVSEVLIAIAGPLASGIIGSLCLGFWLLTQSNSDLFAAEWLNAILGVLWPTNFMLALFNMLPGLPLDGGRVLRAATWHISGNYRVATKLATVTGQFIAVLLVVSSIALGVIIRSPTSFWLAILGAFLFVAATKDQDRN